MSGSVSQLMPRQVEPWVETPNGLSASGSLPKIQTPCQYINAK